jgi:hypothetical protein
MPVITCRIKTKGQAQTKTPPDRSGGVFFLSAAQRVSGNSAFPVVHRSLGACRDRVHVSGSAAHGVATGNCQCATQENDRRKLTNHDCSSIKAPEQPWLTPAICLAA